MAIPRDVAEIDRRLKERRCLRCNHGPLGMSYETGFPEQFCVNCMEALKRESTERRKRAGSAHAERQRQKQAGIDNLDRLTKETP
jgi:hypothetical protein